MPKQQMGTQVRMCLCFRITTSFILLHWLYQLSHFLKKISVSPIISPVTLQRPGFLYSFLSLPEHRYLIPRALPLTSLVVLLCDCCQPSSSCKWNMFSFSSVTQSFSNIQQAKAVSSASAARNIPI